MSEELESEGEAIAIIGMAGRFPGARDVDEFWRNLRDGIESIRPFTPEELTAAGVEESTLANPDFVNSGALADELDAFDAELFGIGPREAEIMDPQHRVFLEAAWEALERAGYDPHRFSGHIGVYGGIAPNTYRQRVLDTRPEVLERVGDYLAMISCEREYAITRCAFKLNLRGPSLSVQTACSTSGVALHLACQSLLAGENDICLVGGARVRVPLTAGYVYQEDGIPSPDGHCRAFDAAARGTAIGNGVGMIAIKRLSDAIEDRDWIHAVVKGTAINNDGSAKVGFTAPGVDGQAAVIAEALAVAGVDADSIQYLEAHGTGTAIGDPIEVAAASRAYRETTDRRGFCGIGSVKTNIGHLDAGAGVAGVIKTALSLEHGEIPPSLHFERPNPQIDFAASPFFVNDRLRSWETPEGAPRRAGISSFGLGGTNAHIILEEAPRRQAPQRAGDLQRRHRLLVWSARSDTAAENKGERLAAHLGAPEYLGKTAPDLADVAFTLQNGRRELACRRALVASSREDAARALEAKDRRRIVSGSLDSTTSAPIQTAFLFPGGGAQYAGMGRDLGETEPVFRAAVERCLESFTRARRDRAQELGENLDSAPSFIDVLWPDSGREVPPEISERPACALPLLFSVEYALAHQWMEWGLVADAMLGHSMGEYAAACLAGVVSLDDACRIVLERGRLFEKLPPGSMLGVPLAADDPQLELDESLSIAAVNRAGACVVSGPTPSIEALADSLEKREIDARRIHISVAAHSTQVEPILGEFRDFLERIDFQAPSIPYVSNVSGTWIRPEEAVDPNYWVRHLRHTVRFAEGLETLFETRERVVIEAGPGQTLSTFARQSPARRKEHVVLSSMRHPREEVADDAFLLGSLGAAWVAGARIDWDRVCADEPLGRVPLPTYAFERKRYWIEPARRSRSATHAPAKDESPLTRDVENDAAGPEPLATATETRKERIVRQLAGILEDLTGVQAAQLDPHATFLELGFDSLLLTQANNGFRRELGVRITFRQLFGDTPTLDSLAEFIDAQLPEETVIESSQGDDQAAVIEDSKPGLEVAASEATEAPTHGPWMPPSASQRGASSTTELSAQQQAALDELVERFTARTRRSKALTQQHRAHLSDPRTAAGFRLPWKELVYPIVAESARGSKLVDVDGNEWLDVTMGFGVTLFGHSPDFIHEAIREQLEKSIAIGPQTALAGEVAELICSFTGLDRAAFCNTGSEAVLAAIRSARTVTGRDRIVVFRNDYHGMFDEVVVQGIESKGQRRSIPVSPGIPRSAVEQVTVLEYGDPSALAAIRELGDSLAAVVVEPIQSRCPDLQPTQFVRDLRRLTSELDVALVFDEMITGFRLHPSGAQAWYGVEADIATYGKVVGGGMPIGIVAGKSRWLDALDGGHWQFGDDSGPEAGVTWFAGTFVRHPLALAAAKAALLAMREAGPTLQSDLNRRASEFVEAANAQFKAADFPVRLVGFASLFHFRFEHAPDDELASYSSLYFHYLRDLGIHCHERRPHFLTTAHTEADIEALLCALQNAAESMRRAGFFQAARADAGMTADPGHALRETPRVEAEVPLTEEQLEIWLASTVDDDADRAFTISTSIDLRGDLEGPALDQAIAALVDRHEALRTTISPRGDVQRVLADLPIEPTRLDLSELSESEQQESQARFHREDADQKFDLEMGPLARFACIRLAEDRHRVVITAHHIICDGWSMGILTRDLGALYQSASTGMPDNLPRPMPFRDWVRDAEERRDDESSRLAEEYWVGRFGGELPVLDLPVDRPRPPVKTYVGGQSGLQLNKDLLERLESQASRRRVTPFALLLAAYSILLKRLTSQDDVVVGVATAGQPSAGTKDLVGHCVRLYPFRMQRRREETLNLHLTEVHETLVDSLDHSDFTYGRLLKHVSVPRDPGRLPLLSTLVTYESETAGLSFGDLELTVAANPKRYCNFDIELYLTESRSGLLVEFHYNRDLFDASTTARWLDDYRVLLEALLEAEDVPVDELDLLGSEEERLRAAWNDTRLELPEPRLVPALFAKSARSRPDAIAVVTPASEDSPERRLTYVELERGVASLASRLREVGLQRGEPVAVCLPRTQDIAIALLGTLEAGGCWLPIDPELPAERIEYQLEDSSARVVLADSTSGLPFDAGERVVLDLRELGDEKRDTTLRVDNASAGADENSAAYLLYTSGSTGRPKGVEVPHSALVNLLESIRRSPGFTADDCLLAVSTFSFDISILEILLPLTAGGCVVIACEDDVRDGKLLARRIASSGATVMQATPATWRLLLETGWTGAPGLKIFSGGEAMTPELAAGLHERCGSLWNLYGPTETCIYSTGGEVERGTRRVTIGGPIANTRVDVVDEELRPLPIGAPGELVIAGQGLALGYRGRPELTAERFARRASDGELLYRTGDVARWLSSGDVEYLGRADGQVKLRGYRIELGEIEAVLRQSPGVRTAAVILREDTPGDARLVGYHVSEEGASPTPESLRETLRAKLPEYMVPAAFVELDALPMTPSRKLDRRALPAPSSADLGARDAARKPPKTETEKRMASIWAEVLGLEANGTKTSAANGERSETLGLDDDFFELGGYSLLAARLLTRVESEFAVEIPLRSLFEERTIGGLARLVEARRWSQSDASSKSSRGDDRVEIEL